MKQILEHAAYGRRLYVLTTVAAAVILAGCGPPRANWTVSYDEALRAARTTECDLLVLYKDHLEPASGQMEEVLEHPAVAPLTRDKVKCILLTAYRPNRRFVAQYGVTDTPAVIVIHPDGTYHAHNGLMTAQEAADFLQSARQPGKEPEIDPAVPRTYEYRWFNIYEDALAEARRRNRKLLILYKSMMSADSSEMLRRLDQPEVARHFSDMVHCWLDWGHAPNREHMARYGIRDVPALVIVHQDGTFHALKGLHPMSEIVRWAVNADAPGRESLARAGP